MIGGNEDRAELAVDVAAAAMFAAAIGFAALAGASGVGTAAAATAAAFLVAVFGLRQVTPEIQSYALPALPLETVEPTQEVPDELILEDELAEVGPHARVVRLFGPSQNHLPSDYISPAPPDASQALVEALAELRRSLQ